MRIHFDLIPSCILASDRLIERRMRYARRDRDAGDSWLGQLVSVEVLAQANRFVVDRGNRTIVVEPYGPNIVRITLSSEKPATLAAPGYGITGTSSMTGWTRTQDSDGYDVIRSGE